LEDVGAASSLAVINSPQPLTQDQATAKKPRSSRAATLVQSEYQHTGVINTSCAITNAQGVSTVCAEDLGRITSVNKTSNVTQMPSVTNSGNEVDILASVMSTVLQAIQPIVQKSDVQQSALIIMQSQLKDIAENLKQICTFLGLKASDSISTNSVIPPDCEMHSTQQRPIASTVQSDSNLSTLAVNSPGNACEAYPIPNHDAARSGPVRSGPSVKSSHYIIKDKMRNLARPTTISDVISDAVTRESSVREARAKSVIISGLPEREDDDVPQVRDLLHTEFSFDPAWIRCSRLGNQTSGKSRLLRVSFQSVEDAAWLVSVAPTLRRSSDSLVRSNVYINRNLSYSERVAAYRARMVKRESHIALHSGSTSSDITTSDNSTGVHHMVITNSQRFYGSRIDNSCSAVDPNGAMPDLADNEEFPPLNAHRGTQVITSGDGPGSIDDHSVTRSPLPSTMASSGAFTASQPCLSTLSADAQPFVSSSAGSVDGVGVGEGRPAIGSGISDHTSF
jgi:hypothetical protein